ncbi:hypothetical protein RBB50_004998 [Rhinocladiella similis]
MQAMANELYTYPGVRSVAFDGNNAWGFALTASQLQSQITGSIVSSICGGLGLSTTRVLDTTCPPPALPAPQCNTVVTLCAGTSLANVGISNGGTCTTGGIFGCTDDQIVTTAKATCAASGASCLGYGRNGNTPIILSESVSQIEQYVANQALTNCGALGSVTVNLSDAACP